MPSLRTQIAPRALARAPWFAALLVLVALGFSRLATLHADDEAWKQRIEKALTTTEAGVAGLDKKTALPGTLVERIAALHARLLPFEKELALGPGSISEKDDLSSSTMDATNLDSRWKAVVKARSAPKEAPKRKDDGKQVPPPPPPEDPLPVPVPKEDAPAPPKKAVGKPWPKQIPFKATAKMTYVQTGAWIRVETEPYVFESKFQLSGYSGKISFTLRATGLIRDVKSVTVRVAVRMKGPVTEVSDEHRLSDVTWTAEKLMGDDSIKSWVNYDDFQLSAPPRWHLGGPRSVTLPLDAEAYVLSLVLADGTELKFETPEYNQPK